MFTSYVYMSFPFSILATLATPLQGIDGQATTLTTLNLTSVDPVLPLNASNQDPSASSVSGLDIQCNGAKYGFNPSLSDCENARLYITPDSEQIIFGQRHTGLPGSTFPLPYMIMGDRGVCFFQPIVIGDSPTGRATMSQIRSAASSLFLRCASSDPSQGGIVSNIGGDNNVAVIMGVYEPKVQCRGDFAFPKSCRDVVGDMPASTDLEIFGPRDAPSVMVALPLEIHSDDEKCVLRLYTTGRSDVVAWYRIWEAVQATFSMCGRFSQGGSSRQLGQQGNVFLTLGNRPPGVSVGNSSDDATA
ncbi:hypothetical protein IMSHALPRED_004122 [Imshaugia aleurites]|uniref:Uncharacterized protein n=1 Tax=Imshaugia aleurites TaxID=172621 RepID=A0A8H3HX84_9LECA|nr:hypothetical protein IMSHALPRED_004122 [Imshaugia aleurites]